MADPRQPEALVGKLHAFQVEGFQFLVKHWKARSHCILADEMGLGKTVQTIALLAHIYEQQSGQSDTHGANGVVGGPFLVLSPLSVVNSWVKEFAKFCPSMTAVAYSGSRAERLAFAQKIGVHVMALPLSRRKDPPLPFHVLITSYENAINDVAFLSRFKWRALIVDEAQRLKNPQSVLYRTLLASFCVDFKVLVTGTPAQNNLGEFWALLHFLHPKKFADCDLFLARYSQCGRASSLSKSWQSLQSSQDFRDLVGKHLLRRIKENIPDLKLPPKREVVLLTPLTPLQRHLYTAVLQRNGEALGMGQRHNARGLVNIIASLRKACNHPYLFDGIEPEPFQEGDHLWQCSGKFQVLHQLLTGLRQRRRKVLLFSTSVQSLDIVQDYLTCMGWLYERLDGSVRSEERYLSVERFQRGDSAASDTFVFLLSTRAGGVGLTLTAASAVIFLDGDWNPQMDLQAQNRVHRIGQTRPVVVIRLVCADTVDQVIARRAQGKLRSTGLVLRATHTAAPGAGDGGDGGDGAGLEGGKDELEAASPGDLRSVLLFGLQRQLQQQQQHKQKAKDSKEGAHKDANGRGGGGSLQESQRCARGDWQDWRVAQLTEADLASILDGQGEEQKPQTAALVPSSSSSSSSSPKPSAAPAERSQVLRPNTAPTAAGGAAGGAAGEVAALQRQGTLQRLDAEEVLAPQSKAGETGLGWQGAPTGGLQIQVENEKALLTLLGQGSPAADKGRLGLRRRVSKRGRGSAWALGSQASEEALERSEAEARKALAAKERRRAERERRKMLRKQELWAQHGYASLALPGPAAPVDSSAPSDAKGFGAAPALLSYAIGSASEPRPPDGAGRAAGCLVLNCVDNSGRWGSGRWFRALDRLGPQPREAYALAGNMGDLQLGDAHLVRADALSADALSAEGEAAGGPARAAAGASAGGVGQVSRGGAGWRAPGQCSSGAALPRGELDVWVCHVVAQRRQRGGGVSGVDVQALALALAKAGGKAAAEGWSVHLPRLGAGTKGFSWYPIERLVKKHFCSRGVPATVYYHKKARYQAPHKAGSKAGQGSDDHIQAWSNGSPANARTGFAAAQPPAPAAPTPPVTADLSGSTVWLDGTGLRASERRLLARGVLLLGGSVREGGAVAQQPGTVNLEGLTHILSAQPQAGAAPAPPLSAKQPIAFINPAWVEACVKRAQEQQQQQVGQG